jgi:hypothetical protein
MIRDGRHLDAPTDEEVTQALLSRPDEIREITYALRDLVREALPGVHEAIDTGDPVLGYGANQYDADGWGIAYIAPYSRWVNLGFTKGAILPDPSGLLEGTGKAMRHVRVRSLDDLRRNEKALTALLLASAGL